MRSHAVIACSGRGSSMQAVNSASAKVAAAPTGAISHGQKLKRPQGLVPGRVASTGVHSSHASMTMMVTTGASRERLGKQRKNWTSCQAGVAVPRRRVQLGGDGGSDAVAFNAVAG